MDKNNLTINAALQINKPVAEVFEAIVDHEKMKHYFIEKSTGRMETGKSLIWKFPVFEMEVPVRVGNIIAEKYVSYYWEVNGRELFVEMKLESFETSQTIIRISEGEMQNDEAGIAWLKGNTEGWANFLACMKAYLEYGIHLREGAFDFRKDEFKAKT